MNHPPDPAPHKPLSPEALRYPPPPWRLSGTMWSGLFPTHHRPRVPRGLSVLLPRHLVIAAIRYLDGDLHYNEFLIAGLVRRGNRIGPYVHHIWVDSPVSQVGGREIWGLDKQLARFDWTDRQVRITTDLGAQITLAAGPEPRAAAPLMLPLPVFTPVAGNLTYAVARARLHAGPTRLSLPHWPDELPRLSDHTTRLALEVPHFHAAMPAPRPVPEAARSRP
ncbi:acetoacetate decarboxylase family protein [Streptomyces pristinaespiralis]|uniref:Acetoacetate decarboxylase n=2 Tax=Streptomyces pristinaespiralis TaxID=38300 RepID=B5H846_STRE2|nr:acetoacetate decarboxylase family protein [Streptomyces pristinaespiralis]ALC18994.1 acetoacetate decarboxylase [Streptomyces pristinaespiralis]EDY63037.1 conserved hypothetical protein [Streptomyces pristinaespiralis ATCC 25486]QMU17897.1 acetoacetate decarboxylase family protein [Streptomyces pristinaespiralis]